MDTVWQLIRGLINAKGKQFKKDFLEEIVGKIVMTDYNKKTYRVDDVTFDESPKSTFRMKDQNVSYIDYYYKVILNLLFFRKLLLVLSNLNFN